MNRYVSRAKVELRRALDRARYLSRARRLRSEGFGVVNPYFTDYGALRGRKLRSGLAEVLDQVTGGTKVDVIVEQGCGDGQRVTPQLRHFAREVWGVDLYPADKVSNCDRYIEADISLEDGHLDALPDRSVDIILVLNYTGMHPTSSWTTYFHESNDRITPYLRPRNFPRILKDGGHIVFVEWEARPEERVGRRSAAEVHREAGALYGAPDLAGFSRVGGGFSAGLVSPYLIYQKV
jgi:SAM-dependent methyltransferase